ncbi:MULTISPECIES: LysE family transporter [unclassified Paenibacillus]|uniref:LysE family transporter n=1 Tax=unclassified Paenibacillus TaxID=185978 RepID=UPI0024B9D3F4|nr:MULTISPECIES: LysE family transporter [unclassified Paenibacillus]
MSTVMWVSFLSYAITTALSPGPNNILVLNAVSNNGMKRSKQLIFGVYFGFFSVMVICGMFSVVLAKYIPTAMPYMKYIGCAYILWLAYYTAISKPSSSDAEEGSTSFMRGFILQFVNVKIILWGITIFTGYVLPYYSSFAAVAGFIVLATIIGDGATHLWAIGGVILHKIINKYWRPINLMMALLLVYSALSLI